MNSSTADLRVAIAQVDLLVGDIEGNADKVIRWAFRARDELKADLVIFPELTLTAYPPEDLLYRDGLHRRVEQELDRICGEISGITVLLGYPRKTEDGLLNMAGVIQDRQLIAEYAKQELPNYSVFDEKRYFVPGNSPCLVNINDIPVGISICEDIWLQHVAKQNAEAGAQLILNLNASPFHAGKAEQRLHVIESRVLETGVPLVYANLVGGQDELVFDGGSFVMDADCTLAMRVPWFEEALAAVDFRLTDFGLKAIKGHVEEEPDHLPQIYQALVCGVRDYATKNGFNGAVIGLSGGIDSALTLAIAVDALGSENIRTVSMPSRYTASMSIEDARSEAEALGVAFDVVEIDTMYSAFLEHLQPLLQDREPDATEENIQARIRGIILMAVSNKLGKLVLTTGNKSEMAVGYCTLYGDMAGGYSVLKDVPKLLVYELVRYRNSLSPVIPQRVIDRPPSAELAPDQKDEDSLPPYSILDPVLEMYVEQDRCLEDIVAKGFDEEVVRRIIRLVDLNEYKRRQAAPGVRITQRAFGRDRRYPITSGFNRSRTRNN